MIYVYLVNKFNCYELKLERGIKNYDVELTEVDKVNKTIKINYMGHGTQCNEWRFFF